MDTGVDIPQAIEHATHYCPNCHNFRRTTAELLQGNEDKLVLFPWGYKLYMSKEALIELTVGGLGPTGLATAVKLWVTGEVKKLVSFAVTIYLRTHGFPTQVGSHAPNPAVIPQQFRDWLMRWIKIKPVADAAAQVSWVVTATFAAALIQSIIFNSGVVLYFPWGAPAPVILPQRSGFDIPVCENCQQWTIPTPELPASESEINPYVNMNYGDGGHWMPDYISRPALPDGADEKYPPGRF